jgi:hypothetical protein
MKNSIYKIDFRYRSDASWALDRDHAVLYVEAPEGLTFNELDLYLGSKKIKGYFGLNSFEVVRPAR